jgi:PmbA protein
MRFRRHRRPRLGAPDERAAGGGDFDPLETLAVAESACQKGSAGGWEVYLEDERRLTIEVREAKVESLISARAAGLGVRVLRADRMGSSYTNDFQPEAIAEAVARALTAATYLGADPHNGFTAPPAGGWPRLEIADPTLLEIPESEKVGRAEALEASALGFAPEVARVRGAEYEEIRSRVWVVNSEGVRAAGETTLCSAALEAVAERGDLAESASELETVHFYDKLDVARVGREAARMAVRLLGARPFAGGRMPVVLCPDAAAGLLSTLAPAVFGDAVAKGRSWLSGRLGGKVASAAVTIVDDGLWAEGPGAFPFDDEGAVSRRTPVIAAGVLQGYLYDYYYGRKSGRGSSANGLRPAYFLPPMVDTTNWVLLPGKATEAELIGRVEDGLYLVEFLGLHTADPITGEFSLGASGFYLRRGRVEEPVTGIAIAGTMAEVLPRVAEVADVVKWSGDAGSPAVLIEEMDISGAE